MFNTLGAGGRYFGLVFYENGQKDTEYEFDLSIKNGIKVKDSFKKWYDNGNKRVEGHYVNGERDGLLTQWHENGKKEYEKTYKDGKLIEYKQWDEDGNLK